MKAILSTLGLVAVAASATAQTTITPSLPPRTPLPSEAASAGITRFSFIAYGDTRGRHDGIQIQSEHQLVIESMLATIAQAKTAADSIRFVLQSGDAVVDGSIAQQLNVSYIPLIDRLTQEGNVPYFLAVGNHDVGSAKETQNARRAKGLANYFATNSRLIPVDGSPRRLNGYPVYAFGYGNTFVLALDSNIPEDSTQLVWAESQLAGLDRTRYVNVVALYHHPAFSSGMHGGPQLEYQASAVRNKWMPLFRKYNVRLLLTGHEHLFEHWVERYKDETGPHRIDQIVSGGGGAPLYGYVGEPDLTDYRRAGTSQSVSVEHLVKPSQDPGANPFHYLVVHVDGDNVSVEVVGVDWGRGFSPYRASGTTLSDRKP